MRASVTNREPLQGTPYQLDPDPNPGFECIRRIQNTHQWAQIACGDSRMFLLSSDGEISTSGIGDVIYV